MQHGMWLLKNNNYIHIKTSINLESLYINPRMNSLWKFHAAIENKRTHMKVLIIYAHPSRESFTYKVLNRLYKGLSDAGHEIEISDLYLSGFNAEMSESEYEREGFAQTELPVSEDVLLEHQKIDGADCIVFLYPVWWSDCPAKLKGWFDRVYSVGYAYSKTDTPRKMKLLDKGLVICTAGYSNKILQETGIADSMKKVMLGDRLGNRFNHKKMIILGGTLAGEKTREGLLEQAYQIGKIIDLSH